MSEAILTRGIPGSGKSTWAKQWVAEAPDARGRVNRDDIRLAVFGRGYGVDERVVSRVQTATIRALVDAGKDMVIDNTNLNPAHTGRLVALLNRLGVKVTFRDFDVPVETAIKRDAKRAIPVGADVIRMFADRRG